MTDQLSSSIWILTEEQNISQMSPLNNNKAELYDCMEESHYINHPHSVIVCSDHKEQKQEKE